MVAGRLRCGWPWWAVRPGRGGETSPKSEEKVALEDEVDGGGGGGSTAGRGEEGGPQRAR
jgi:hypothetical protein